MRRLLLLLPLLLALAACGSPDRHADHAVPLAEDPEHAHHEAMTAHGVAPGDPWARPASGTAAGGINSAVYFVLDNPGDAPLRLVAAETDVAARVELHETTIDADGVMRMREVQAIEVPPGGSVALEPGGLHVMLLDLRRDLAEGDTFPLTLRFDDGGTRMLEVTVRSPGR